MEITALDKPREAAWKSIGGHPTWAGSTFAFKIEAQADGCVLYFRQDSARDVVDEQYGRCNFNWGFYLGSLPLLAETGRGKPYMPATPAEE
jgi:hypothetical protein